MRKTFNFSAEFEKSVAKFQKIINFVEFKTKFLMKQICYN